MTHARTDWTREEIAALFDLPFTELVYRAAEVHRESFDPPKPQTLDAVLAIDAEARALAGERVKDGVA